MWGGFWFGYMLGSERNGSSNSNSSNGGGCFLAILIIFGLFFIYKVAHLMDSKLIYFAHHPSLATKLLFPYVAVPYYHLTGTAALKTCVYAILGCLVFLFVMYWIQSKMSHSLLQKMFIPFKLISIYAYGCVLYNGFIVGQFYGLEKWGVSVLIKWLIPLVIVLIIFRGIRMLFIPINQTENK